MTDELLKALQETEEHLRAAAQSLNERAQSLEWELIARAMRANGDVKNVLKQKRKLINKGIK